ncbi:hypothetical protein E8E12_006003 [Didymella heteroderae]|uniref:Uncharacterized protein n=1 Tax=Didymella heteroderae TaxID=1769908 RepID=A0A9P4WN65_9PLEO|nr:hypothetical protein E8E12_006003 [Didymella heteroderae]
MAIHAAESADSRAPPVGAVEFEKLLKKYAQSKREADARLTDRLGEVSPVTYAGAAAQETHEIERPKRTSPWNDQTLKELDGQMTGLEMDKQIYLW